MVHQLCSLHEAELGAGKLFIKGPDSKYVRIRRPQGLCFKNKPCLCRAKAAGWLMSEWVWLCSIKLYLHKQVLGRVWLVDGDVNLCSRCWGHRAKAQLPRSLWSRGNLEVNKTQLLCKEMWPG